MVLGKSSQAREVKGGLQKKDRSEMWRSTLVVRFSLTLVLTAGRGYKFERKPDKPVKNENARLGRGRFRSQFHSDSNQQTRRGTEIFGDPLTPSDKIRAKLIARSEYP